ncbi:MAG: beta-ketoacyl-[acyl-carrier-protein] synthase family protein [Kiritimatiellales bacterium]|nr:beta-ketoacyl-[acyl-carrier-protein] synthase family protein [Kiritimatiellales bacterium]
MIGKNRVVITGLGVLAANGIGKEAFWNSLLAGESGIGPVTQFDITDMPHAIAGEISNFDPSQYLNPSIKPKRMGRFTQLAIAAAQQAIADSGLSLDYLQQIHDLPIVMGSSAMAMDLLAQPPSVTTAVNCIPNAPASAIAYINSLNACIHYVSNGCASSLDAVALASTLIRQGKADVVIAGGSDSTITHYVFDGFNKARKLPKDYESPQTAARPFDLFRKGGVIAEGAGVVILESEEHASERGIRPYCYISGYGTCIDPLRSFEAAGIEGAMRRALDNAGVSRKKIDYISAHAPSDPEIDLTETNSIKAVFGEYSYQIPVTSIKGACGSAMGTGGVHQLIATCLTMRNLLIPASTNYTTKDPDCDLDHVPLIARTQKIQCSLINTHGFGRSNGSMVLENV